MLYSETHTKRQATQHGCLPKCPVPSLLGDGEKETEIVYGEEKIFCTGPTRAVKAEQNLLYRHDKPNEPTKKDPFHLSSLSPHSTQFQQSAGVSPL